MIKMSIVIPIFNSEKHISKCLESITNQTLTDIEIVLVDDGSNDESAKIIKSYQKLDNRIKYIFQKNSGPGVARNTGLEYCSAEYVAFIDSDDWVKQNFCYHIYNEAKKNNADIVYFNYLEVSERGSTIGVKDIAKFESDNKEQLLKYQMTGKMPWGARSRVVKRSIISKNNIKFSTQRNAEELIFSFKSLYFSEKLIFIKDPLYYYLIRKDSQSRHSEASNILKEVHNGTKNELVKMGIYKEFNKPLNGLLISSYIIRLYAFTQSNNIIKAYKNSLDTYKEFSNQYSNLQYDQNSIDSRVRTIAKFFSEGKIFRIIILGYGYRILNSLRGRS